MQDTSFWRPAASSHLWMWATSNHLLDALSVMESLDFRYISSVVWVKVDSAVEELKIPKEEISTAIAALQHGTFTVEIRPNYLDSMVQIGLGQYMRHAHEWLLLGVRGDAMVPPPAQRPPSVVFAPRTKHSAKPKEAYDLMEKVSPGPRLEMFARIPRDGWDVWGNEV